MRFRKFEIASNASNLGLPANSMDRLGDVVAILGPNGAGKTRLLAAAIEAARSDIGISEQDWAADFKRLQNEIRGVEQTLNVLSARQELQGSGSAVQNTKRRLKDLRIQEKNVTTALSRLDRYSHPPTPRSVVAVLTNHNPKIRELGKYHVGEMEASAPQIANIQSIGSLTVHITPFLHALVSAIYDSHNPESDKAKLGPWIELYAEAQRLVRIMMRMELGYEQSVPGVVPTLNNRRLSASELSSGQQLLLYFVSILLSHLAPKTYISDPEAMPASLHGAVVFIDEPELHLHPAAEVELLQSLRQVVGPTGQLWIATHSLSLLSVLEPSEIWTIDNGKVSPPGAEQTGKALSLLIGHNENVDRLRDLLHLPSQLAASRFAAECLLPPTQVAFNERDPQLFQITRSLLDRVNHNKPVSILDFGAGRGRLATALVEHLPEPHRSLVRYIAVEPSSSLHPEIIRAAGSIMVEDPTAYRAVSEIPSRYDGTINAAVVCNVLHEIRPTYWREILNSLMSMLDSGGAIILCEDQDIPHGECPNDFGFLVLGVQEIRTLFSLKDMPNTQRHPDPKYSDRLVCVEVPVAKAKVTRESVNAAIIDLRGRLEAELRSLRQLDGATAKHGRRYALVTQMYVNAEFALKEV